MPAQEYRDQLPGLIRLILDCDEEGMSVDETAAHVLKAGWRPPARVITDSTELDALPAGSVVYARSKAYTAVPDFDDETQIVWLKPGAVWAVTSAEALEHARGSVTVLHTPENGDTRA